MNLALRSFKLNLMGLQSIFLTSSRNGYSTKPATGGVLAVSKKKKMGKLGPIMEKKEIPVETDVKKLVNYVCGSNINKTGEDIKISDDKDYPEWLWNLKLQKSNLEDLDPNTKQYWRKLRTIALRRNNQLAKLKKF